jgi:hypothetical protein
LRIKERGKEKDLFRRIKGDFWPLAKTADGVCRSLLSVRCANRLSAPVPIVIGTIAGNPSHFAPFVGSAIRLDLNSKQKKQGQLKFPKNFLLGFLYHTQKMNPDIKL